MPMMTCPDGCTCEACEEARQAQHREDMANVGEAVMERIASCCPKWSPADCPSEIVVDLTNAKDELRTALTDLVAVFDAEAQGVAQQVTKPERIAAARAVLEAYDW